MKKPYLMIAEILLKRGLADYIIKEITTIDEHDLLYLKRKWGLLDSKA